MVNLYDNLTGGLDDELDSEDGDEFVGEGDEEEEDDDTTEEDL